MASRTILITGATGFLGGAFLDRALREPAHSRDRFLLLARGSDDGDAAVRVLARLARFRNAEDARAALARCRVLRVDLAVPSTLEQTALDDVTHCVHLGANTSFISSQGVWETNFHGTLALARRLLRAPNFERFLYVGTAMICGERPPPVVAEDMYPSEVAHLVPYTASKSATEQALLHELADLPLVIARPSIVVGHTRLGCVPSGSIFWVFRALHEVGLVSVDPATTGIDVVPADWVADALDRLLLAPRLAHRIYHLSAGTCARTNLAQLTRALDRALERPHDPTRFVHVPAGEIQKHRARLANTFGRLDGRRMELVLSLYLGFCALDVTFDNTRLLAEGMPAPPPLAAYVATCMHNPQGLSIVAQAADEL